jgi:hypothetical protein
VLEHVMAREDTARHIGNEGAVYPFLMDGSAGIDCPDHFLRGPTYETGSFCGRLASFHLQADFPNQLAPCDRLRLNLCRKVCEEFFLVRGAAESLLFRLDLRISNDLCRAFHILLLKTRKLLWRA